MKVMFLVAMARPRFDSAGRETWSGKIGVWPLVEKVPAKRSSVNRPARTLETKPIGSITREVNKPKNSNKILCNSIRLFLFKYVKLINMTGINNDKE